MTTGGSPRPAVRAVGLTKGYGKVCALDHLDLELAEGEILGYLGPNGAGKTTAEHAHLDAGAALAAGANAVPQALCVLAAGLLAFGIAPRTTTAVTYGMLSWSFLVDLLGGGLQLDHWLLDMSPVHEMAAVPLVGLDWSSAAVLVAVAAVATAMGGVAFAHRDLELE